MPSLTVGTWNVGDNGTKDDLKALMAKAPVWALQEMGDRDGWFDWLHDKGWGTTGRDGPAGATPVVWDKTAMGEKVDSYNRLLSPSTPCKGTGPDTVKEKRLVGVGFNFPGYQPRVRIGCLHLCSDSSGGCRRELAKDEVREAKTMWKGDGGFPDGFCVIAGDWNTSWNNDLLNPMEDQNWKTAHAFKVVRTHGDWTPDQQWYRHASIDGMGEVANHSDHDALWVRYNL